MGSISRCSYASRILSAPVKKHGMNIQKISHTASFCYIPLYNGETSTCGVYVPWDPYNHIFFPYTWLIAHTWLVFCVDMVSTSYVEPSDIMPCDSWAAFIQPLLSPLQQVSPLCSMSSSIHYHVAWHPLLPFHLHSSLLYARIRELCSELPTIHDTYCAWKPPGLILVKLEPHLDSGSTPNSPSPCHNLHSIKTNARHCSQWLILQSCNSSSIHSTLYVGICPLYHEFLLISPYMCSIKVTQLWAYETGFVLCLRPWPLG